MSLRSRIAVAAIAIAVATPALAQQTVVVGGIVVSGATEQSLPYSTVSIAGGAQRFTGADGSFNFELTPGAHSFRIRQLGFAPLDTTINVVAGVNQRALVFRLQPVAIRLDAIRTYATTCRSNFQVGEGSVLLDELTRNAEREKLFRTEYPFVYELERRSSYQGIGGKTPQSVDTLQYLSRVTVDYSPGNLVHLADSTKPNGVKELRIPSLVDLADPTFVRSHCFRFPGMETVGGARTYRIDFQPSADLDATDVEGSAFIDSTTLLIRKAIFRLTKPEKLHPPAFGLEVTTLYHEVFNGLTLFEQIHTEEQLTRNRTLGARQLEDQKLLGIKFYGRTPEDIYIAEAPKRVKAVTDSTARIAGTVVDSTGRRLRGAEILVANGSARATTGDSGQFLIKGLKPGKTEFLVRALGFGPATFTTELRAGRTRQMRVILRPTNVQLSTITVLDSLSAPLLAETGFFDRKKAGWGSFITPEEIERRNPTYVADMLRSLPGVEITAKTAGRNVVLSTRSMSIGGGRCEMDIWVDKFYMNVSVIEDAVSASEIGAIEVYPSASEIPPQFIRMGSDCGAVIIWTKGWLSAESQPDSTKHD